MVNILVALAGSPDADTADFVCTGTADDVQINAAIAAAAAAGGGTVRLAAGTYNVSSPITILDDNIHLEGAGAGLTSVVAASDWTSTLHPNGAHLAAVIAICASDEFSVRGITVDAATNGIHCNGIVAIPDGVAGAGTICTHGVIADNAVFTIQAHAYSIWSLRSDRIDISNNFVDGGSTTANSSPFQEGIEIYGGNDVTLTGNIVKNIGGSAFNIGGIAAATPDCSVNQLVMTGNVVENARVGVSLGTTFDGTSNTTADLRDITIAGNDLVGITEIGISVRNWSGSADHPPVVSNLTISDNTVTMAVVAADAGPLAAWMWFFNGAGLGNTEFSAINITENSFSHVATAEVFPTFYLQPGNEVGSFFYGYENVSLTGNQLDSLAPRDGSVAMAIQHSRDFSIVGNVIDGAGVNLLYAYATTGFAIEQNSFLHWDGADISSLALLLENSADASVLNNSFTNPRTTGSPRTFLVHPVEGPISGNTLVGSSEVTLLDSGVQGVTLAADASAAIGNALANHIAGNDLDNLLYGLGGDDTLVGGAGNDTLVGGAGNDMLFGGLGADRLDGGAGFDWARYDAAAAAVAVDLLNPSANTGEAADDTFFSIEALAGSALGDALHGDNGANVLAGLAGNDYLSGRAGDDVLLGGDGNDHLVGGAGSDVLDGGSGYDYARYHTALGGVVVDLLFPQLNTGDAAGDTYFSVEGIIGSPFNDVLRGDASGNDLVGLEGNDVLDGREGNDGLQGGAGNDMLIGGLGADRLDGGVGYDYALYHTAAQGVVVDLLLPWLNTGDAAGDTFTSIEGIIGSNFSDVLRGDASGNDLAGLNGDDLLDGREGNDGLQGGAGNDVLIGGLGSDRLIGGTGADTFVFDTPPGPDNIDAIADFESGVDTIQLVASGAYSGLPVGQLAGNALHVLGEAAALTQATRIIYDPTTGALYFDADGSGAQGAAQFAVLGNRPDQLQATDFNIAGP